MSSQIPLFVVSVWVIVDCFRFGARFSSKAALMTASVLYAVIGAILSGLGSNDPKACIDLRITSIFGTILTGIDIILSAWASLTNPDETALGKKKGLSCARNYYQLKQKNLPGIRSRENMSQLTIKRIQS